jgi:hypothetical protein
MDHIFAQIPLDNLLKAVNEVPGIPIYGVTADYCPEGRYINININLSPENNSFGSKAVGNTFHVHG